MISIERSGPPMSLDQSLRVRDFKYDSYVAIARLTDRKTQKMSDRDFAKMAQGLVRRNAIALFELGLFPAVRIQERQEAGNPNPAIVDDCMLSFVLSGSSVTHYIDLEGRIFSHGPAIVSLYDPEM